MAWIFAVAAAAGMGAAGYWIGKHHREDGGVISDSPEIREVLKKEIGEALENVWENRDSIAPWPRLAYPALPDSALAEDQVAGVHGKINAAAEIASLMATPRGPRKTGILPMEDLTGGRVHPFLEWLNSQGCVAGARVPMASAEGRTAYGLLNLQPGEGAGQLQPEGQGCRRRNQAAPRHRLPRDRYPAEPAAGAGITGQGEEAPGGGPGMTPGPLSLPGSGRAPC